jgi:hypothetical protein
MGAGIKYYARDGGKGHSEWEKGQNLVKAGQSE